MLSQPRLILDTSRHRLEDLQILRTRMELSSLRCFCQNSTQWLLQRSYLSPKSTIQTLTNLVEFAWTSWKTNGHLLVKSEHCFSRSNSCLLRQISMILWINWLLMPGSETKTPPSTKHMNGPWCTPELSNEHLTLELKTLKMAIKLKSWSIDEKEKIQNSIFEP